MTRFAFVRSLVFWHYWTFGLFAQDTALGRVVWTVGLGPLRLQFLDLRKSRNLSRCS